MQDFKFGGCRLSEFGGRLTERVGIEIAQRDVTLVDIPGKDGSDCIDNGRYKNVDFTRSIALTGDDLAERTSLLIRHFAYRQGYAEFEDTEHPGMVCEAILTNFTEVVRELRTLRTATLNFSRKPYWYLKAGLLEQQLDLTALTGDGITLYNPFPAEAKPLVRIYYPNGTVISKIKLTINGAAYQLPVSAPFTVSGLFFEYDLENKRAAWKTAAGAINSFPDMSISEPFRPGTNTIAAKLTGTPSAVKIIPRWRCL